MPKPIRKLRHWKQQFRKDARFVWRKRTDWNGRCFEAGEVIPEDVIAEMGAKVRRFWESNRIELADFSDGQYDFPVDDPPRTVEPVPVTAEPQGEPETASEADSEALPDGIEDLGGSWFAVTVDGETTKVRGRAAAEAMLSDPSE